MQLSSARQCTVSAIASARLCARRGEVAVLQAAQIREQQQEADRAKATVHRTAAASAAPLADGSFQLVVPFPRKVRYGTVR